MKYYERFDVKDSGERQEFDSGMVRDVTEDKVDYTLAFDGPMFERYAAHLTKGAQKYDKRNWMKAQGREELDRFIESATRHFIQWLRGDNDEDHAAAVLFNINGAEYVRARNANAFKNELEAVLTDRERKVDAVYYHDSNKYEELAEEMVDDPTFDEPVDAISLEPGDVVMLADRRVLFEDGTPVIGERLPLAVTLRGRVDWIKTPAWDIEESDFFILESQIEVGSIVKARPTKGIATVTKPADHSDAFLYGDSTVDYE